MEVAIDAGAEDLSDDGDHWVLTCAPHDLAAVRAALEEASLAPTSAELSLVPTSTVAVTDEVRGQEDPAPARGHRRPRRRPGRPRQLRHPRRGPRRLRRLSADP